MTQIISETEGKIETFCDRWHRRLDFCLFWLTADQRSDVWRFIAGIGMKLRAPIARQERNRFGNNFKERELARKGRRLDSIKAVLPGSLEFELANLHEELVAEWANIDEMDRYLYEISSRSSFLITTIALITSL